ncbi:MAG: PIN domain-containing protein [Candidatus Heimdallarchaeota archaeon]|nr:PIN domain-containing protein [Candidatus Heimdallarchaeota archaeon]
MFCLDSDILIAIMRGNQEARDKLKALQVEGIVFVSSITIFELFFGAYLSEATEQNLQTVSNLLAPFSKLNFSFTEAQLAGQLSANLQKKGSIIGIRDCMIAAVVISNNKTLVTRNIKHFSRIQELRLHEW